MILVRNIFTISILFWTFTGFTSENLVYEANDIYSVSPEKNATQQNQNTGNEVDSTTHEKKASNNTTDQSEFQSKHIHGSVSNYHSLIDYDDTLKEPIAKDNFGHTHIDISLTKNQGDSGTTDQDISRQTDSDHSEAYSLDLVPPADILQTREPDSLLSTEPDPLLPTEPGPLWPTEPETLRSTVQDILWATNIDISETKDQNISCLEPTDHLEFQENEDLEILMRRPTCRSAHECKYLFKCNHCQICECPGKKLMADCHGADLGYVPQTLPKNISSLLLGNNSINDSTLYENVFARYTVLEELHLGFNNISTLPEGIFEGLYNLRVLDLHGNNIQMNSSLNASHAFSPLNGTLQSLMLNGNTPDPRQPDLLYPDYALSFLTNLSSLTMDGLQHKKFGRLFGLMLNLVNLSVSGFFPGYCEMEALSHITFHHLSQIQHLNISNCGLNGSMVDKKAFSPLTNLISLDLSSNFFLGLEAVGNLMYGLRNSKTLRHLRLERVVPRFSPCIVVYKHTLRYFKNTSITKIEAMYNEIEMIEFGALKMLPPTLQFLNLTSNKIMFGTYWKNMAYLESLEFLHLDGFFKPVEFPNFFPKTYFQCQRPDRTSSQLSYEVTQSGDSGAPINDSFILPLPPNLKIATMHSFSMAYTITNISFCPNNSLEFVDVSNNHFKNLSGPVTGLNRLKVLNMSKCFIETISNRFFDNLTSLEHLNLFQNLLGDRLNADLRGYVFDRLVNLKVLNLSFNNLYRLNKHVFSALTRIEILDLSINRLSHLNFSIANMTSLRFIDLHRNNFNSLPKQAMEHISWLRSQGVNITLDMRQNPILCDCDNLPFLEWVVETQIFGSNYSKYYCKLRNSKKNAKERLDGYDEVVERLQHRCTSNTILFLIVAGLTLLLMLMMVSIVLYQFRWTLRYWYHAAKMKLSSNQKADSARFKYDVFISYANADTDFVLKELCPKLKERNVSIFVHGEKFKIGRYISDNIYKAVRKCRKTLFVVTSDLLASQWCNYELQMARKEAVNSGRDVSVFLFLEEMPTSSMGPQVLSHVKNSTYIAYPKNPQYRGAFWDKLADDLRSP